MAFTTEQQKEKLSRNKLTQVYLEKKSHCNRLRYRWCPHVGRMKSCICDLICMWPVYQCLHSKSKMALAIDTKVGRVADWTNHALTRGQKSTVKIRVTVRMAKSCGSARQHYCTFFFRLLLSATKSAESAADLYVQFSPSIKQSAVVAQPVQRARMLNGFPKTTDHVEPLPWLRVGLRLELHCIRPRSLGINQRQHQKSASQHVHTRLMLTETLNHSK